MEPIPIHFAILWTLLGIIISLVLPVAVKTLRAATESLEGTDTKPTLGQRIAKAWVTYGGNKYLGILLAASVVAAVIVFLLGLQFAQPREAVLTGFAWESFINKLYTQQKQS